jgi:hypothetical protein
MEANPRGKPPREIKNNYLRRSARASYGKQKYIDPRAIVYNVFL